MGMHNNSSNIPKQNPNPKKTNPVLTGLKIFFTFLGKSLATLLFVGAITGSICIVVLSIAVLQLVDTDNTVSLDPENLSYTSTIYTTSKETGQPVELQRYHGEENRIYVDIVNIPEDTKNAFVAVEDKRFYEHAGVDWIRTVAATLKWLTASSSVQGGSTIDQQLIKNITGNDEVSPTRKVQEIFSALNLEKEYSKEAILGAYLNTIHLGRNTNGVQAASLLYFNKEVKDISLVQSAALAAMTKSPVSIDPVKFPKENADRREYVLNEMLKLGYITEQEMADALVADIELDLKDSSGGQGAKINSYIEDYAISSVINIFVGQGFTRTEAERKLGTDGLKIYTTIDLDVQKTLEEAYSDYKETFSVIKNEEPVQASQTVLNTNGKILGMMGGTGKKSGNRVLNRASGSYRPPSSSVKPFVYGLGIEYNVLTYSTMLEDKPISLTEDGETKDWPKNYYGRYDGWMTLEEALRRSVNPTAVKAGLQVGIDPVFDFLKNSVGISSLADGVADGNKILGDREMSLFLGSWTYGVSTLEWSGAYQIFANGGFYTKPYVIDSITNAEGKILYEADTTPVQVIGDDTSFLINKILQGVVYGDRGTAPTAKIQGTRVAGKTGTSTGEFDQWFAGITPNYVSVIWIGYDTNKIIRASTYPPPVVWQKIMSKIEPLAENPKSDFPTSESIVEKSFCAVSGELPLEDCPIGGTGFYKASNIPPDCRGHERFMTEEEIEEQEQLENESSVNDFEDDWWSGYQDDDDNEWWR